MDLTLRGRVFLIVLIGAVLPLVLLSAWFTRTAQRSGETLLRERLEASLEEVVQGVGLRWLAVRGDVLRVAELPAVQAALVEPTPGRRAAAGSAPVPGPTAAYRYPVTSGVTVSPGAGAEPAFVAAPDFREQLTDLRGTVVALRILDAAGEPVWTGTTASGEATWPPPATYVLPVRLGIYALGSGRRVGTLEATVRLQALLSESAVWGGVAGSVLGAFASATGASLLPLSLDPSLLARDRFTWRDEAWLSVRRGLEEPPLRLALAAPVAPFAHPFRESARRDLWILALVTAVVLALATLLTRRTTRDLRRLAAGAEAVARGDLRREVEATRNDEVGRVGRAFNAMTASLRGTLQQLSQRQALAAVGEFAASLAHEVRNPLTSIRLDLQRVEEMTSQDGDARELVARTLRRIDGLDRSVTGALQVARSGSVELERLDVRGPLKAAIDMAHPTFRSREAVLETTIPDTPIPVEGDAVALERLFLNLLLNAAQVLEPGGRARVELDADDEVRVSVHDDGPGIEPGDLDRVFEPFYSSRPDGTGLGLPIARRIARAHGGRLELHSEPGAGTTVTLGLPGSPGRRP